MERIEPNNVRGAIDRAFDFTAEIARLLAFPVLVWTTKPGTWGTRFLAGSAAAGLSWFGVIGIACARFLRNNDLFYFWIATIALLILHRVVGIIRRLGGYACDAGFPGASWFWFGPGGSGRASSPVRRRGGCVRGRPHPVRIRPAPVGGGADGQCSGQILRRVSEPSGNPRASVGDRAWTGRDRYERVAPGSGRPGH